MPHYLMDSSRFIKELMNLFDVRGKIKKLLINKLEIDLGNIPRAKEGAISYFEVRQGKITLLRGLNNYELQLLGKLVFLPTEEGIAPGIYLDEYNYWDTIIKPIDYENGYEIFMIFNSELSVPITLEIKGNKIVFIEYSFTKGFNTKSWIFTDINENNLELFFATF